MPVNVAQLRNVNLKIAGNTNDNNGKNDVLLDKQTLTVKGDGTYVTTKANNQTIDVTLTMIQRIKSTMQLIKIFPTSQM